MNKIYKQFTRLERWAWFGIVHLEDYISPRKPHERWCAESCAESFSALNCQRVPAYSPVWREMSWRQRMATGQEISTRAKCWVKAIEFQGFVPVFSSVFLPSEISQRKRKRSFGKFNYRSTDLKGKAAVFLLCSRENPFRIKTKGTRNCSRYRSNFGQSRK